MDQQWTTQVYCYMAFKYDKQLKQDAQVIYHLMNHLIPQHC